MAVGWQALIVGALAGAVGLAEIVSRYRSDPKYALTHSVAAWFYIAVNAGAGVGALYLIRAFDLKFGQTHHIEIWRVLIAGFGTIAFFRSSFFVTKIGGSDVGVGPSLVLGALLDFFDREVDRKSAEEMSQVMSADQLAGLDPDSVMSALPVLCLALMQNFAPADQALLGTEITKTRNDGELSPQAKMRAVTVQLAKYLSADLVKKVLVNARDVFLETPSAPKAAVLEAARKQLEDQAVREAEQPDNEGGAGAS